MKVIKLFVLLIFIIVLLGNNYSSYAQNVGINDNGLKPDSTAILDVNSTTKGMLIPRVVLVDDANPIEGEKPMGLLVFNSSNSGGNEIGFYYWTGTTWTPIDTKISGGVDSNGNILKISGGKGVKVISGADEKLITLELDSIFYGGINKAVYGDSINIASVEVDTLGRIKSISNVPIRIGKENIRDDQVDGTKISINQEVLGSILYCDGSNWITLNPESNLQNPILALIDGKPTWKDDTGSDNPQIVNLGSKKIITDSERTQITENKEAIVAETVRAKAKEDELNGLIQTNVNDIANLSTEKDNLDGDIKNVLKLLDTISKSWTGANIADDKLTSLSANKILPGTDNKYKLLMVDNNDNVGFKALSLESMDSLYQDQDPNSIVYFGQDEFDPTKGVTKIGKLAVECIEKGDADKFLKTSSDGSKVEWGNIPSGLSSLVGGDVGDILISKGVDGSEWRPKLNIISLEGGSIDGVLYCTGGNITVSEEIDNQLADLNSFNTTTSLKFNALEGTLINKFGDVYKMNATANNQVLISKSYSLGSGSTAEWGNITPAHFVEAKGRGAIIVHDGTNGLWLEKPADYTVPGNFLSSASNGDDMAIYSVKSDGTYGWLLGSTLGQYTSDKKLKENFKSINSEHFLLKIKSFKDICSWNYKSEKNKTKRHYGPMAQEIFKAFGKDGVGIIGAESKLNYQDMIGINFISIHGLVNRTEKLQKENQELKSELESVKKELEQIKMMLKNFSLQQKK